MGARRLIAELRPDNSSAAAADEHQLEMALPNLEMNASDARNEGEPLSEIAIGRRSPQTVFPPGGMSVCRCSTPACE